MSHEQSTKRKEVEKRTIYHERETATGKANRFIFGDDVFISYARQDAAAYSLRLANELTKKELSCFLDQWGAPAGKDIPEKVIRALKRSTMFILLGTPGATKSSAVEKEIREFRKTGRTVIPISFDGALEEAGWYAELVEGISISPETSHALETGSPSERIITRIVNAENFTRRNKRLRRYFGLTALSVLLVILASAVAAYSLVQQARASVAVARDEAALAQQERKKALDDVEKAIRDLQDAQVSLKDAKKNQREAEGKAIDAAKRGAEASANAREQQRIAEEQARRGEHLKYSGDIQSARQSILAGDVPGALQTLDTYLPQPGVITNPAQELRGFEWYYLWRLQNRELGTLSQSNVHDKNLIFSPNGEIIAGSSDVEGGDGNTVRLWSIAKTGEPVIFRDTSVKVIKSVAFSPDGQTLATASEKAVKLWNVSSLMSYGPQRTNTQPSSNLTGRESAAPPIVTPLQVVQEERDIETIAFLPSGSLMTISSIEKEDEKEDKLPAKRRVVNFWRIDTASSRNSLQLSYSIDGLEGTPLLSPDGSLLVGYEPPFVTLIKLPDVTNKKSGPAEWLSVWVPGKDNTGITEQTHLAISFSSKGEMIAIGAGTRVWILDTSKLKWGSDPQVVGDVAQLELKLKKECLSLAFSPEGEKVLVSDGERLRWLDITPTSESITIDNKLALSSKAEYPPITDDKRKNELARNALAHHLRLIPRCAMDFLSYGTRFISICPNRGFNLNETIVMDVDKDLTLDGVSLWDTTSWEEVSLRGTTNLTAWMSNNLAYDQFSNSRPLAAFSHSSNVLAVADKGVNERGIINLWNVTSPGDKVSIITDINFRDINQLELSPDGRTLAVQTVDSSEIKLFEVTSGKPLEPIRAGCGIGAENGDEALNSITGMAFSADSRMIAILRGNGVQTVELWDISARPKCTREFNSGEQRLNKLLFMNNDRTLAIVHQNKIRSVSEQSVSQDSSVTLWDVNLPRPKRLATLVEGEQFAYATLSPNGEILATCSTSESTNVVVKLWDTNTLKLLGTIRVRNKPSAFLSSSVMSIRGVQLRFNMSLNKSANAYAVFSSDSRTLAVYGVDETVKLYSTSTSQLMMSLADNATVTNVAFSPDNRSLLTFNEKGEIKLWPGATDGMLLTAAK